MTYLPGRKMQQLQVFLCMFVFILLNFRALSQPHMSRFVPATAGTGDTVSIYGQRLSGATNVSFGNVKAASFRVYGDTLIQAIISTGNSGYVKVTTSSGSVEWSGFVYKQEPPVIYGVSPNLPLPGETFFLIGKNLRNASVTANCGNISADVNSDEIIAVHPIEVIGTGPCAISMPLLVSTPGGSAQISVAMDTSSARKIRVDSISPMSGDEGVLVSIYGANLENVTQVAFTNTQTGSRGASIQNISNSVVKVLVPNNLTWGKLVLTFSVRTQEFPDIMLSNPTAKPYITSIASNLYPPNTFSRRDILTIKGANLGTVTRVMLGGDSAASFNIINASTIEAVVGRVKQYNGYVSVYNSYGKDSIGGLTATTPYASPNYYSPTSGRPGDTVTITGNDLDYSTQVSITSIPMASFQIISDLEVRAIVPNNGASGYITVLGQNGQATKNTTLFTFIPPGKPGITSFFPVTGTRNDSVFISGTGLQYITAIYIGGIPARKFGSLPDGRLWALPGRGTSTSNIIKVENAGGVDSVTGFTLVNIPVVDSVKPAAVHVGEIVTIYGAAFTGVTEVKTGSVAVASFQVLNDSVITAVIGNRNTGRVYVSSAAGGDTTTAPFISLLPDIRSFSPQSARPGVLVTIKGIFNTASWGTPVVQGVSFGGTPAASFEQQNDSTVTAVTGNGATGNVVITLASGKTVTSSGVFNFIIPDRPRVSSFSPASGYEGDSVVLRGFGFTDAVSANIGGVPVKYLYVNNDTTAGFRVGKGATGPIEIRTLWGSDSSRTRFTFLHKLSTISSFVPVSATRGDVVTITGANMNNVRVVYFGGVAADSVIVLNDTTITAKVAGGKSGNVILDGLGGRDSVAGFTFIVPRPSISSFSPKSGAPGSKVIIDGTNLDFVNSAGYSSHINAPFTIISPSRIELTVGDSVAGLPVVWVQTATGYDSMGTFTWIPPAPQISSFYPASAKVGDSLFIRGRYLRGTYFVNIAGVAAEGFKALSDSVVAARIATSVSKRGPASIIVVTLGGRDTATGLNILMRPEINSVNPPEASIDEVVDIMGEGFTGATEVKLANVPSLSFEVISDTRIRAVVAGAYGYGNGVVVTTPLGSDTSMNFTYVPPSPDILNVWPKSAAAGDTVIVFGKRLKGELKVTFGGVEGRVLGVQRDSIIRVIVGNGASGNIVVSNASGADTLTGFVFKAAPVIYSFTPSGGFTGDSVTVKGKYFTGALYATAGGVGGDYFYVYNDSTIGFRIAISVTGKIVVKTPVGADTSDADFVSVRPQPRVTSFSPTSAAAGDAVYISGTNLHGVTGITFGGVALDSFYILSPSLIRAWVGSNSRSGSVKVNALSLTDSLAGFTWLAPQPRITSFTPQSGGPGTKIAIKGRNFTGVKGVAIGGVPASSYSVASDSIINAQVSVNASNTSTPIIVNTAAGRDTAYGFTVATIPVVSSISPESAETGQTVIIKGTGLNGVTAVYFGYRPAASFKFISATQINAVVDSGATGKVRVVTSLGQDTSVRFTYMPPVPEIHGFDPAFAETGDTVSIYGRRFGNVYNVSFGGVSSPGFRVFEDTLIRAVVGTGASGAITATNWLGTDTSRVAFTFVPASPHISSFAPLAATLRDSVIINGARFKRVTGVTFGGVPADSFVVISAQQIKAWVGKCQSGAVKVTTVAGVDSLAGFTFTIPKPSIASFNPKRGVPGTVITISGTNLDYVTQAGYASAAPAGSFSIVSPTRIDMVVGDSVTGRPVVWVSNNSGYDSLAAFTWLQPLPDIISFTPQSGKPGTKVVIKGRYFKGVRGITIGGVPASSYSVASDSVINAQVSINAYNTKSSIVVNAAAGRDTAYGFIVNTVPVVASVNPSAASAGETVVINGTGLNGVTDVFFGYKRARTVTVISATQVNAVVDSGATGMLGVISAIGMDSSKWFTYLTPVPEIRNFTPAIAQTGDTVYIYGKRFAGILNVTLGNVSAGSYHIQGDTLIKAVVASGASGRIAVTTRFGTDTSGTAFTYTITKPELTSFAPAVATVGDTVIINGLRFKNVTSVSFGGVAADSFRVLSEQQIKAWVGRSRSGMVKITTAAGLDSLMGFTLIPPKPVITSFSPKRGVPGTVITVTGKNLDYVTEAGYAAAESAASFTSVSPEQIGMVVGDSVGGKPVVWVKNATGYDSLGSFTWVQPPPRIISFSPESGKPGTKIVIKGKYFRGIRGIAIGGVPASSYSVASDSIINAQVSINAYNTKASLIVIAAAGRDTAYGFTVNTIPVVTSISPSAARGGETVVIKGTGLNGVTGVSFGNRPAASFTVVSATQVNAVVDSGATGKVQVSTFIGADSSASFTYLLSSPYIGYYTPVIAKTGDTISIYGNRFSNVSAVTLGRTAVAGFRVYGDTIIKAVVGSGASGRLVVNTPYGVDTAAMGFTFVVTSPELSSFAPATASLGDTVIINGIRLKNVKEVTFGGVAADSFIVLSEQQIMAWVGKNRSGVVKVTTVAGTDSLAGFTFKAPLSTITSFSPLRGTPGTVIAVTGTNLDYVTEAGYASGGIASFTIVSSSHINLVVGDAVEGKPVVWIRNSSNYDSLGTFTWVQPAPEIISFTPQSGKGGTKMVIKGKYFKGTKGVAVGGVPAASYSAASDSVINVVVSINARNGNDTIIVITAAGRDTALGFTVTNQVAARMQSGADEEQHAEQLMPLVVNVAPETNRPVAISIYPNPTVSSTTIQHPASERVANVLMYSMSGALVRNQQIKAGEVKTILNVSNLPRGVYKIVWSNGATARSATIILE